MVPTKALVLAGGRGTRLRPYTTVIPKPLMPLGESTIVEKLVDSMLMAGIRDVTVSLGHLGYLIRAVLDNNSDNRKHVSFVQEDKPLGTAGSLRLVSNLRESDVLLVVNGDTLTDFDFNLAVEFLRSRQLDAAVVVKRRTMQVDFGVVEVDSKGLLNKYIEKPEVTHLVSTGINVFQGYTISRWLPEGKVDMPDFLRHVVNRGGLVGCLETNALWQDLGRYEDLEAAQRDVEAKKFVGR